MRAGGAAACTTAPRLCGGVPCAGSPELRGSSLRVLAGGADYSDDERPLTREELQARAEQRLKQGLVGNGETSVRRSKNVRGGPVGKKPA